MKNCLIFFGLFVGSGLVFATSQTAINQDKPTRLYVKSYNIGNTGIEVVTNGLPWNNQISEYNEKMNWRDGVAGSYYYESKLHEYNRGIIWGTLHEAGEVWYDNEYQEWQPSYWPVCSEIDSGHHFYYSDLFGPYTNIYNVYVNTYTNTAESIYQEHCDANYSGHIPPDPWGMSHQINYRRSAETTMHLQTGGKAGSKLKNLFGLTATATQNNPTNYSWDLVPKEEGNGFYSTNIPSQNIAIGSHGNLLTNGVLYKSFSDNADVDVTPFVANVDYYMFNMGQPQKYHSYFEVFVDQPHPGTTYYLSETAGHAFWQFKTDAPTNALQYIAASLTTFVNKSWGFYPHGANCGLTGQLQNDSIGNNGNGHPFSVKRVFYIGFNDLISGLQFTRGISNTPPIYCFAAYGYSCVGAATDAGSTVGITLPTWWNPWNWMPQNFGAAVVLKFPGTLDDETPRYSN